MTPLPPAFLGPPLAHRAYHDLTAGRPENSRAAIRAAIAARYGVEIDVQMSADGVAMVFHDYLLERLTGRPGAVQHFSAADLATTRLIGGGEGIPTLAEVVALIAGRAPLLIEIKDQDGAMGPDVGRLEAAVAADLAGYGGPVAVMSFNPHSVAAFGAAAPDIARGLTSCAFVPEDWPSLNERTLVALRGMPDIDRIGATFISHDASDLTNPRVAELKAQGLPVLCWTIRSPEAETQAREIADNVTFEGYAAALPA